MASPADPVCVRARVGPPRSIGPTRRGFVADSPLLVAGGPRLPIWSGRWHLTARAID